MLSHKELAELVSAKKIVTKYQNLEKLLLHVNNEIEYAISGCRDNVKIKFSYGKTTQFSNFENIGKSIEGKMIGQGYKAKYRFIPLSVDNPCYLNDSGHILKLSWKSEKSQKEILNEKSEKSQEETSNEKSEKSQEETSNEKSEKSQEETSNEKSEKSQEETSNEKSEKSQEEMSNEEWEILQEETLNEESEKSQEETSNEKPEGTLEKSIPKKLMSPQEAAKLSIAKMDQTVTDLFCDFNEKIIEAANKCECKIDVEIDDKYICNKMEKKLTEIGYKVESYNYSFNSGLIVSWESEIDKEENLCAEKKQHPSQLQK